MRIDGHCTAGPSRGYHTLRTGLPLHAGDTITAVIQRRPQGTPDDLFLRLQYRGDSPFSGAERNGTVECIVVPREVAILRSKREVAAVDTLVASAAREKPSFTRPPSTTIDAARVHLERAAMWLGWASPELVGRVAKLDATQATYEKRLDALIASVPNTMAPINAGPFRVTLNSQICGAALHARYQSSSAGDCALELAVDNTSKKTQWESAQAWWFHPAHDTVGASMEAATVIEVPRELAAGDHSTMLVDGFEAGAVLLVRLEAHLFLVRSP